MTRVLELVDRMRTQAFSRNRNFDAFAEDGTSARARRVWRHLRSLERSLADASRGRASVRVEELEGGTRRLTIEWREVRIRRVAMLSAGEYLLLRQDRAAAAVLDAAIHVSG